MKPATGSHTGTGTWLLQRATGAVLALALPLLLVYFVSVPPTDFVVWQATFSPLWLRLVLLLVVASIALHAWVGMRDILMDYVHATLVRLALYLVVIVTLAGSVAWLAAILFGTTFWSAA